MKKNILISGLFIFSLISSINLFSMEEENRDQRRKREEISNNEAIELEAKKQKLDNVYCGFDELDDFTTVDFMKYLISEETEFSFIHEDGKNKVVIVVSKDLYNFVTTNKRNYYLFKEAAIEGDICFPKLKFIEEIPGNSKCIILPLERVKANGFNIKKSNIDTGLLRMFLSNNTKNLSSLDIGFCKNVNCQEVDFSDFSSLEELILNEADINTDKLNQILDLTGKTLKKLEFLQKGDEDIESIKWEQIDFSKLSCLQEVDFSCTGIDEDSLNNLFKYVGNTLESLSLDACYTIENWQNLDFSQCSKLKKFKCCENNLDIDFLNKVFTECKELKELKIEVLSENIEEDIEWENLDLTENTNIEILNLNLTGITLSDLQNIINKFKNLKVLEVCEEGITVDNIDREIDFGTSCIKKIIVDNKELIFED